MKTLADFVHVKRNEVKLTQKVFIEKVGVALAVIQKIKQGIENPNQEKVKQALKMYDDTLAPVSAKELGISSK
jgi:predicted transcriptional regulator